ncbi:MAG: large repetitive protein [Chloroflexota bacterium]|nr:large repetitive protein [Chloroflexota bacterium]
MWHHGFAQKRKKISILIVLSILSGSFLSSGVVFAEDTPTEVPSTPTATATATLTPTPEEIIVPASEEEPTQVVDEATTEEVPSGGEETTATETPTPTEDVGLIPPTEATQEEIATETPTETYTETPTSTPEGELAPVIGLDNENLIPGRYLIVYKNGIDQDSAISFVMERIEIYGGKIRAIFNGSPLGLNVDLTEQALSEIRQDVKIEYIMASYLSNANFEKDIELVHEDKVSANAVSYVVPWELDRIDQASSKLDGRYYYPDSAGQGVHVYVIDTGVYLTHEDFEGRIGNGYDFIGDDDEPNDPCVGHGTEVAGIIGGTRFGVARKVTIHPIRIVDCSKHFDINDLSSAIQWVIDNHQNPAVINMSLQLSGDLTSYEVLNLEKKIKNAIRDGITVVASAGNDGINACNITPARIPSVITVAATNEKDERATFSVGSSNYGNCVDIFAPGIHMASASIDKTWYPIEPAAPIYKYSSLEGTSFSAPIVTGAIALYLSANPNASPNTVFSNIISNSTAGVVRKAGTGSPNIFLTISYKDPNIVQLLIPKNGYLTSDNTPTLSWNAGANANRYHVQVSSSAKFSSTKYDFKTSDNEYTLGSLADGKYYWRVSAYNPIGVEGDWSKVYSFTIDTTPQIPGQVVLVEPGGGYVSEGSQIQLTWNAVAYAYTYQVQIDNSIEFLTPEYSLFSDEDSTSVIASSLTNGTWYWRVRAKNADGIYGAWSDYDYFIIEISVNYLFESNFNVDGDLEGWVTQPESQWEVSSGLLTTSVYDYWTSTHDYTIASIQYDEDDFDDFVYETRIMMEAPTEYLQNGVAIVVRGIPSNNSIGEGWDSGYSFLLEQMDSLKDEGCFYIFTNEYSNGNRDSIGAKYDCSGVINYGDFNIMRVVAEGTTIQFYINEVLIETITDAELTSGKLGLMAWEQEIAEPISVYVDWARAYVP